MPERLFHVTAEERGKPGRVSWDISADSPLGAIQRIISGTETVSTQESTGQQIRQLAQDLLEIVALFGGASEPFVMQDARIQRAAAALGMNVEQAYTWMSHL